MITKEEILTLLKSTETYRVERTISTNDMDKFQEAICAFSNDLPNSRKKGYLILGANDNGNLSGLRVTDNLMKKLCAIRSDGNILPLPVMAVDKYEFPEGDLLIVEVTPSLVPPVRYRGRTFIRIGPRRDIATEAEERILFERRTSYMATFDATPCFGATINDIDTDTFTNKFLAKAIDAEVLRMDTRSIKEQMAAVGMFDLEHSCPTYAAIMLFGNNPKKFLPGAYVQFVRFKGDNKTSEIDDERQFCDNYCDLLPKLESLLEMSVVRQYPVPVSILREDKAINYPYWALRELLMNACMHRDLQSNTPLRFYEFANHIEIMNAGGLYGNARPENFPTVNDYRNPLIASAMKTLGYVNMYNRGIGQVMEELERNGNPPAEFKIDLITAFAAIIKRSVTISTKGTSQADKGHKSNKAKGTSQADKGHKSNKAKDTSQAGKGHKSELIIEFCATPRSMAEIANFLGVTNYRKARERYINPQLGITLERTIPDKPTSSKQKYVAIKK